MGGIVSINLLPICTSHSSTDLLAVMQLRHVDLPDGGSGEGFFVKVGDFIAPVVAQLSLECAFGLSPWHEVGTLSDAVEYAL